jgi:hypothetical protein
VSVTIDRARRQVARITRANGGGDEGVQIGA